MARVYFSELIVFRKAYGVYIDKIKALHDENKNAEDLELLHGDAKKTAEANNMTVKSTG
jgi:hypothetical protein